MATYVDHKGTIPHAWHMAPTKDDKVEYIKLAVDGVCTFQFNLRMQLTS